jgi:hypothetical protein
VLSYGACHETARDVAERPDPGPDRPLLASSRSHLADDGRRGPFLAAVIARLAAPKENLAAFAVATALAWMVESPIIMMLSASNALVRDGVAYRKLRRFSNVLNGAVTAVMIVMVLPPVFDLVRGVMAAPTSPAPGRSMIFLVPREPSGSAAFYQGILISNGRPRR